MIMHDNTEDKKGAMHSYGSPASVHRQQGYFDDHDGAHGFRANVDPRTVGAASRVANSHSARYRLVSHVRNATRSHPNILVPVLDRFGGWGQSSSCSECHFMKVPVLKAFQF